MLASRAQMFTIAWQHIGCSLISDCERTDVIIILIIQILTPKYQSEPNISTKVPNQISPPIVGGG